ncbi:MAG TPA: cupin domain-containing protein [Aliidongia sp.]|nr:cupin domain-containing protein [Aliidongia sp.]
MTDLTLQRRSLLLAPLLAAAPKLLMGDAEASTLDPAETIITMQDKIDWQTRPNWPKDSVAQAPLFGDLNKDGLYYILIKWYPGYMSAPHYYATDRLCVVVSGTWWVNSGPDFDPKSCVPVPAGSFVRRVATTPHYDGVVANGKEPVVIAICGIGPVKLTYIEPDKPGWRQA